MALKRALYTFGT